MILTVTLNPSVDRAIYVKECKLGDTNRVERTETDAGGKGINLSRVADELGAQTLATGFLGGGPGAFVTSVLKRQGVPCDFVPIEGDTRINFSVEDEARNPPTTFNESGPKIHAREWESLIDKCRHYAPQTRWACVGGSVPPGLSPDVYKTLLLLFKEGGCRTLLDADGEPLKSGLEAKPDLVKPNAKEAERLLGRPIKTDEDAVRAAREILELGVGAVILSRGEEGAVFVSKEGTWIGKSPKVDANSTIGSGDSMLGAHLWALEEGKGLEEAFQWGLAAGAATATTSGSEIARRGVIEKLFPSCVVERAVT